MQWSEGDAWVGCAALPTDTTIEFKYIVLEGGRCVGWGDQLSGGAGGNMELLLTHDDTSDTGYQVEVSPAAGESLGVV